MLFMMALSVSSHFNCFWRGWILFLSNERSGAGKKLSSCSSPSTLLGVSPADSPWSVLQAHDKNIFKMANDANDGDKKRESN